MHSYLQVHAQGVHYNFCMHVYIQNNVLFNNNFMASEND